MPRFVILRHELPSEPARQLHWDLMFESQGVLRTWALLAEPCLGTQSFADELADHRLAYLDYEGPISSGRGIVSRWDAGEYRLLARGEDAWSVILCGSRLQASVLLERQQPASHSWRVSFGAAPTNG